MAFQTQGEYIIKGSVRKWSVKVERMAQKAISPRSEEWTMALGKVGRFKMKLKSQRKV